MLLSSPKTTREGWECNFLGERCSLGIEASSDDIFLWIMPS